jgi:putative nucleotidyltransferase with HDIG domain
VIEIWARAWKSSPWARLEECPKGLPLPGESLVHHTRAVVRTSLAITDTLAELNDIAVDRDHLIAIGLLHDVSRLHEYKRAVDGSVIETETGQRLQHAFLSAAWAEAAGLPLDIVHGITAHTPQSAVKPQTQEALIVYYADFIHTDALRLELGLEPWAKRK